jgi:hypothetical protein
VVLVVEVVELELKDVVQQVIHLLLTHHKVMLVEMDLIVHQTHQLLEQLEEVEQQHQDQMDQQVQVELEEQEHQIQLQEQIQHTLVVEVGQLIAETLLVVEALVEVELEV